MINRIKDEEKILSPEFLEEIRRIREQRGISIEEVAEKTNIKLSYIRAIEDGDMSRLPGGIYNRAFIRSISEFLGIDTRPFERKAESDEMIKERQVKIELGKPQNASMPNKLTIIGCLFVIFFLYAVFYGPRTTRKENIQNSIEEYHQQQIAKAEEKIKKAKTVEEHEMINSELQAKISDDSAIMKKISQVTPVEKSTYDSISKELVITLLAVNNVKVTVKDDYGKTLLDKEMVVNEAVMLNGSDEYLMSADNIANLEVYLDGVQIRDVKKIERKGNDYVFRAEGLVNVAESQSFEKPKTEALIPIDLKMQPVQDPSSVAVNPTVNQNADSPQNNPQGTGR